MKKREFIKAAGAVGALSLLNGCAEMPISQAIRDITGIDLPAPVGAYSIQSASKPVSRFRPAPTFSGYDPERAMRMFKQMDAGVPVVGIDARPSYLKYKAATEAGKARFAALRASGKGKTINEFIETVGEPFVLNLRATIKETV